MANKHSTLTGLFTDIADAIRAKTGHTDNIIADQFPEKIAEIDTQENMDAELTDQDAKIAELQNILAEKAAVDLEPELATQDELISHIAIALEGKAGGSDVPTCTVRFVDGYLGREEDESGTHADYCGYCVYTAYINGNMTPVIMGDPGAWTYESNFDITLENVVCGSMIFFSWTSCTPSDPSVNYYGVINIAGSESASVVEDQMSAANEGPLFSAPLEPNAVCTITLNTGIDSFVWG